MLVVTLFIIVTAFVFTSCMQPERPLSAVELFNLGERYLLELNFEQALVQFTALIEIESMNPRGYLGAAEAYLGLGQPDEAIVILQLGFERTGDIRINNILDSLIIESTAYEGNDANDRPDSLDLDYEELDYTDYYVYDLNLTDEQHTLLQELIYALLNEDYLTAAAITDRRELQYAALNEDHTAIAAFSDSNVFQQLVVMSTDKGRLIYHYMDTNIVVFPFGFVYMGNLYNGLRSGYGLWFHGSDLAWLYSYYSGQWENDLPNGQGIVRRVSDDMVTEYQGTFHDGIYHGEFVRRIIFDDDRCNHRWPSLTYIAGIIQMVPSTSPGWYTAGKCEFCGTLLFNTQYNYPTHVNQVHGVLWE